MFVAAQELTVGERFLTAKGSVTKLHVIVKRTDEPVFNIEVHREHVYCAGTACILVHNSCPEFAYRSLNPIDIANIQAGIGVIRSGRKGPLAFADTIQANARDTRFIPVTETFDLLWDKANYIKFRPGKLPPGTYKSMDQILNDKSIMRQLSPEGRRWIEQQAHGMAIGKIPLEAIEELVIDGVRIR